MGIRVGIISTGRMQSVLIISSLVLLSITTVLAQRGSAVSFSGGSLPKCRCTSFTTWNQRSNREVGNCQTRFRGRRWCYINALPVCDGEVESTTTKGLFYSFDACDKDNDEGRPAAQPNRGFSFGEPFQGENN